jgi:LAO/AO transport system kinase
MTAPRLPLGDYVAGVLAGDRAVLARAITLVESDRDEDETLASALLGAVLSRTGRATRVGLSGVPGVGKSTLIETLGVQLADGGKRVAVLAVDPSSTVTGGSILGDKTRMPKLSARVEAFIRPSPSAASLGGVARRTRETMLLCEAAGFDVILVETVGVGQSETTVCSMVDTFVVLALPGAGDELQGIKKGILELADVVAVTKADGDNLSRANAAMGELRAALGLARRRHSAWAPDVRQVSGLTGAGVAELWQAVERARAAIDGSGELALLRKEQGRAWLRAVLEDRLLRAFASDAATQAAIAHGEEEVASGARLPADVARDVLAAFRRV